MDSKQKRASVVNRIAPPVALWIVNRILTQPDVLSASSKLDKRVKAQTKKAEAALRSAKRNAAANSRLLSVGLAAIGVGVGLVARAAMKR